MNSHKQRLEDSALTTLRVPGRTMCKQVHCRDRIMHCSALPAFVPFEDSMAWLVKILSSPPLTWDLAFLGRVPLILWQYCLQFYWCCLLRCSPCPLWVYALKKSLCHSFGGVQWGAKLDVLVQFVILTQNSRFSSWLLSAYIKPTVQYGGHLN